MQKYIIYADGASSNNQDADKRIGGWGCVVFRKNEDGKIVKAEKSGKVDGATNNQMELLSVIEAMRIIKSAAKNKAEAVVHSDSQYVVSAIENNEVKYKKNGWRTKDKKPIKNPELWKELDDLMAVVNASFVKVEGHADVKWNEYCDKLAKKAYR